MWGTAEIQKRWQPRSLKKLAGLAHMSKANLCYGLDHLERHGWVIRHRQATLGRGYSTAYSLEVGKDCECRSEVSKPQTLNRPEVSKAWTGKCPKGRGITPGQDPVPAKSVTEEEISKEDGQVPGWPGWPSGTIGAWENRDQPWEP